MAVLGLASRRWRRHLPGHPCEVADKDIDDADRSRHGKDVGVAVVHPKQAAQGR